MTHGTCTIRSGHCKKWRTLGEGEERVGHPAPGRAATQERESPGGTSNDHRSARTSTRRPSKEPATWAWDPTPPQVTTMRARLSPSPRPLACRWLHKPCTLVQGRRDLEGEPQCHLDTVCPATGTAQGGDLWASDQPRHRAAQGIQAEEDMGTSEPHATRLGLGR